MKDYIYVDFENLNNLSNLKSISGKYIFFIGSDQKKLNTDLVVSSNDKDIEWIKISGNGKNALDFHIVYYISKYDNKKDVGHYILSKDTGFDPLISHLEEKGIKIKRIININEVGDEKNKPKIVKNEYNLCLNNLVKIAKTKRPKSIKTLTSHFKTLIGGSSDKQIEDIIEEMFRNKIISSGQNNRLKYLK